MKESISIIVPCYNEQDSLPMLFEKIRKPVETLKKTYDVELVFVDDGSRDKTYSILKDFAKGKKNVKVLKHEVNRNLGAALKTGFKASKSDLIITIDSDCTYSPDIIPGMVKMLKEKGADIVIASAHHPKGGMIGVSKVRVMLSIGNNIIYSLLLRKRVYTLSSMVRVYRSKIKDVEFRSNDFLAVVEIAVNAIKKGFKIAEYPTKMNAREKGASKARIYREIRNHIKFMARTALA